MATVKLDETTSLDLQDGEVVLFANAPFVYKIEGIKMIYVNLTVTTKRVVSVPYTEKNKKELPVQSFHYNEISKVDSSQGDANAAVIELILANKNKVRFAIAAGNKGNVFSHILGQGLKDIAGGFGKMLDRSVHQDKLNASTSSYTDAKIRASWGKASGEWDRFSAYTPMAGSADMYARRDQIAELIKGCLEQSKK